MAKDLHVAMLWGGWADEREISFDSATACKAALFEVGYANIDMLDVADDNFINDISAGSYDVAFVAMHGAYGEDGCIQGLLEVLHIPYTFSGVEASANGADKKTAKILYKNANIPTPRGVCIKRGEMVDTQAIVKDLGLPLFVKPAVNGSSFGVTKVEDESKLKAAIDFAHESSAGALVEQCIVGTEITVPVLGNDDAYALDIIEVVTDTGFYDLVSKYEPSELHHILPARIDEKSYKLAQKYAVDAHRALGCKGCSRSDFIVQADGTPVILETNTIPGMTKTSLLPDAARHAGIEFPDLCDMFIKWALE